MPATDADGFQVFLLPGRKFGLIEQISGANNGIEWGANLVAHVGQKLGFGAFGFLCLLFFLDDLFLRTFQAFGGLNQHFPVFLIAAFEKRNGECQKDYPENIGIE